MIQDFMDKQLGCGRPAAEGVQADQNLHLLVGRPAASVAQAAGARCRLRRVPDESTDGEDDVRPGCKSQLVQVDADLCLQFREQPQEKLVFLDASRMWYSSARRWRCHRSRSNRVCSRHLCSAARW